MVLLGTDAGAAIWAFAASLAQWQLVMELGGRSADHSPPVAAVDWAHTLGRPHELVAVACGSTVIISQLTGSAPEMTVRART